MAHSRNSADRPVIRRRVNLALSVVVALSCLPGVALAQGTCDGIAPVDTGRLSSVDVITDLSGAPVQILSMPGDPDRLFVVLQDGRIVFWRRGDDPGITAELIDLDPKVSSGGERGLLGMAFDPNFETNGFFYVSYTADNPLGDTVLSRLRVTPNPENVDAISAQSSSEAILFTLDQPEGNHNGGQIHFGPDGYLYLSLGDGGGGGDPFGGQCGHGQDVSTMFGTILRLSVDGTGDLPDCGAGTGYRIPTDNPLHDGPGGDCDEIWASGFRNPWRFDIDPTNGDLYIGDVGQACWEEVNYLPVSAAGGNFGWRSMEGSHCFNPSDQNECDPSPVLCPGATTCNDPSLRLPIAEYSNTDDLNCAVIGGVVYRGCRLPAMEGRYFFGDHCEGFVHSLRVQNEVAIDEVDHSADVDPTERLQFDLVGFGRDSEGEIYLGHRAGSVLKVVPPFALTETSGTGGTPFSLFGNGDDWTWENVQFETMVPITEYRIYRGTPGQPLSCITRSFDPDWSGDGAVPDVGELFGYVVTAVDANGVENSPGAGRVVGGPCP